MTKKQPRMPEMHAVKPNRQQRRHPEGTPQDHPLGRDTDAPEAHVADIPAKNTGAGKRPADKWNQ
jgi:hypothetical protein